MTSTLDIERDLREFEWSYRLGLATGWDAGYMRGVADEGAAWTAVMSGVAEVWRRPRYEEVERARQVDYQPCRTRCSRCSRCIASLAYWSRGGRPYLGVEREAALRARARGAA